MVLFPSKSTDITKVKYPVALSKYIITVHFVRFCLEKPVSGTVCKLLWEQGPESCDYYSGGHDSDLDARRSCHIRT